MQKLNFKEIFNIPNTLSFTRIILIIPFVLSVAVENYLLAGGVLLLSGLSDVLDGFFARRLSQTTVLGKVLDPIADKLTLIAVMICTAAKFSEVFPFMMILIAKEFLMLVAGGILLKKSRPTISARWYGKVATAAFYVSVITIIGMKAIWARSYLILNLTLMCMTAVLMFYALFKYFVIFKNAFKVEAAKKFEDPRIQGHE